MARVTLKLPPLTEPIPVPEVFEMPEEEAAAWLLTEFGMLDETVPMALGDA